MIHFNNGTLLLPVTLFLKFFLKFNYLLHLLQSRFSFFLYCLILDTSSEACSLQNIICILLERRGQEDTEQL